MDYENSFRQLDNLPTGVKIFCNVFGEEDGAGTYLVGWYETLEDAEDEFIQIENWCRINGSVFKPAEISEPKVVLDPWEEGK